MSRYSKTKEKYLLTFYGIHDEYVPDVLFAITNQGTTNYTSVPIITITPTPATAGVGMKVTCILTAGKVTSIVLLNKGYGYSRATSLALAFSGGGGAGAVATATLVHKGYSRTIDNLTTFDNCKRYRFNLNNLFSNIQLGLNSVVVIDSVSIPALITAVADPFKYVRICDISDNVYDTERKGNNNAIVLISKSVNTYTDYPFLKNSKKFRIPPNFFSKGYIEFEVALQVSSVITAHVRFVDSDFAVSLVVYEEDFEDSNDTLLAPPVPREPQNKYFNNYFPNYNNT
jgi:hypothetical protein